jgi:hypothetical protein
MRFPLHTQGLMFLLMALGCGGRSTLLFQDSSASGGRRMTEATGGSSGAGGGTGSTDGVLVTGTKEDDQGTDIAVDEDGNVVIVGITKGALAGAALGDYDAFVRKFDPRGNVVWTRQFGSERDDAALALAIDREGDIFVVGRTAGSLEGPSNGYVDAFVRKYDRDGGVEWTRQFDIADWDCAYAVAVDAQGNALVAGGSNEDPSQAQVPFLRTYAPNGQLARVYDLDVPSSTMVYAVAVAADGSIYLAGSSGGELEGPRAGGVDAILMKLDADGHVAWTRQSGTEHTDEALAVAVDRDGNPWVAGYEGSYSESSLRTGDGFVRRYDSRGTLIFSHLVEDSWWGNVTDVAVDGHQHGFVVGMRTESSTLETTSAFMEELDAEGTLLGWPLGDSKDASASGLAISASGSVYLLINPCGSTFRGHRVAGACDAFVVQMK